MASLVADYGTSSGSDNEADSFSDHSDNICKEEEDENDDDDDDEEGEDEGEQDDEDEENVAVNYVIKRTRTPTTTIDQTSNIDNKLPLPTPDFNVTPTLKTSVFSNPFVEAEKAKSAILEKHVKMTPTLDDTKMINGKKICWNYRKGRCRFGHNCTFAHDSDLHRSALELESSRAPQETLICQTTQYNNNQSNFNDDEEVDEENNQTHNNKRKKRPGLTQNLIPGKKVMKMYKAQQQQQTKSITR